jgi:PAS domain S-box-containing protein
LENIPTIFKKLLGPILSGPQIQNRGWNPDMKHYLKTLGLIVGVAAVYFCSGKCGLTLAFVNASASAIWPPTGITLAALLIWGHRLWPGIFIGAFLVNITTQGTWGTSLGIATGNTLEALVAAGLVRKFVNGLNFFEHARMALRFILLAAMSSTAISATFGVASLCLGHYAGWQRFWTIWSTWWIGDMTSNLAITPLLVIWMTKRLPKWKASQLLEGTGLLLTLAAVGWAVFLGGDPFGSTEQLEYLTIPPLLWAAFRFGPHGAVASVFIISGIALWGTLHRTGPFVTSDPNETLLLLQTFTGIITMTILVLTAVILERRRFQWRLQVQDAVSRILAESTRLNEAIPKILQVLCEQAGWDVGAMWQVDRTANKLFCSEVWHATSVKIPEFENVTRQTRFDLGIGLPGRVWLNDRPSWIRDVTQDDNFPRASMAMKAGLHTAICFPIKFDGNILGVMECYRREIHEPDIDFIHMLVPIGHQLGQFIERKRAENTLVEAHKMFASISDGSTDAIFVKDVQGCYLLFNKEAARIVGKKPEAVIGKDDYFIFPADEAKTVMDGDRKVMESGRVLTYEEVVTTTDGIATYLSTKGPIYNSEGKISGLFGIARDITVRKQAEAELRTSKLRFQQLTESIREVFWLTNLDKTEMIYISPGYEEIWGRSCASLFAAPQDWLLAVHPEDRERMLGADRANPAGGDLNDEYRIIRPDGSLRWIYSRAFPVYNENGKVYRIAGIAEDITQRKQAEFDLALLAHGVESTSELICITDLENRFVFTNPAFREAYGYTTEEIIGKTPEMLYSPNNPPLLLDQILQQSRAGGWSGEVIDLKKNGMEFSVFLKTSQVKDHNGKAIALMGVAEDITVRKRAEKFLVESEARLRLINEQVPAIIWTADRSFKFTSASGLSSTDTSIKPHDLVGRSLHEVYGTMDENHPGVVAHRRALGGERTMVELEFWDRFWRCNIEPLVGASGTVIECIGVAMNITESKKAEGKFKELADIVQSSEDGIVNITPDEIVVNWNRGAEQLLGYAAQEIIGKSILVIFPPDQFEKARRIIRRVMQGESVESYETTRRHKDGTLCDLSIKVSPVTNAAGKIISMSAIYRDIRKQKQLERTVLEISASERRRIGHDLHDGLGQHLAGIAFKAKVLEEALAAESPALAGEAGQIVNLINEGIRQTRGLAQGLDPVDLEVAGLPAALQKLAGEITEQFHLICDFHCDRERLTVETQIGLAFYRIAQEGIHNAIRHGKAQHIVIDLETGNNRLCLKIHDNGKGFILQENLPSGMGLRIMRYRASSIGGNLTIHSQINAGTDVVCVVPEQMSLI